MNNPKQSPIQIAASGSGHVTSTIYSIGKIQRKRKRRPEKRKKKASIPQIDGNHDRFLVPWPYCFSTCIVAFGIRVLLFIQLHIPAPITWSV